MTLSSLIRQLQAIRRKRGDLRVYLRISAEDICDRCVPVLGVEVLPDFDVTDIGKREVVLIE